MKRNLVLTMGDENFRVITDISFPLMKEYADKIGADFCVISKRAYPDVNICYEKFQARGFLERYSRIAYLDGDVLVRPRAVNLFNVVPYGHFAAVDEMECLTPWTQEWLLEQASPYGWVGAWEGAHFNAGVMVFDETHKRLFENPIITNIPWWDQPCLNVAVKRLEIPFLSLPVEFNTMPYHVCWRLGDIAHKAHMIHFAGPMERKIQGMREYSKKL